MGLDTSVFKTMQTQPRITTQVVDGKAVTVSNTGAVLGSATTVPVFKNQQIAVLGADGTPIFTTQKTLNEAMNETTLPEVEITASPLTAFGLTTKATYIIVAIVVLAAAYFVWKKYGKK